MTKPKTPSITVGKAIDRYLKDQGGELPGYKPLKASSLREHDSFLRGTTEAGGRPATGVPMARHELGRKLCRNVTDRDFNQYFNERTRTVKTATVRKFGNVLNRFLAYCVQQKLMTPDVLDARKTRLARGPQDREWITPEQLDAIWGVLRRSPRIDDVWTMMMETGLESGARTEELISLRRSDLDPLRAELRLVGKGSGNDGKERHVRVTKKFCDRWYDFCEAHRIDEDDWIFYHRMRAAPGREYIAGTWRYEDRSKHITDKSAVYVMSVWRQECVAAAGRGELDRSFVPPKTKWTPKVLRKTYASQQLIAHHLGLGGLSLLQLQEALGHDSLDTTRIYVPGVNAYLNLVNPPSSTREVATAIARMRAEQEATRAAG